MECAVVSIDLPGLRRQSRADETRRRLLDAAAEVFAEKGYHNTAMDDIVAAAERSKGAAYFHFPSKRDIFEAVLGQLAGLLENKVERAISKERDPVKRLDAALGALLDTFAKHQRLARIALIELAGAGSPGDETLYQIRDRFARLIQRHLDAAAAEGALRPINTRLVSVAWFGAVNELVVSWLRASDSARVAGELPALRALLLRSVALDDGQDIAGGAAN